MPAREQTLASLASRQDRQDHHIRHLDLKLDQILAAIGAEPDSSGHGATGLNGRLVRVEARLASFDRLKDTGAGVVMAAAVFLGVLWWMAKDRLAALFQLGSTA